MPLPLPTLTGARPAAFAVFRFLPTNRIKFQRITCPRGQVSIAHASAIFNVAPCPTPDYSTFTSLHPSRGHICIQQPF